MTSLLVIFPSRQHHVALAIGSRFVISMFLQHLFILIPRDVRFLLLAPTYTFRIDCLYRCPDTSSLSVTYLRSLSRYAFRREMPCKHPAVRLIKIQRAQYHQASDTPSLRFAQQSPAFESFLRFPRQHGKSCSFIRGEVPSFSSKNSPLKGKGIKCRGRSTTRQPTRRP